MFNSRALLFATAITAVVLCLFKSVADATALAVINANASAPMSRAEQSLLEKRGKKNKSKYSGKATWFIPSLHGGSMGACRKYEADDDYVVAMNAVQYGRMNKVSDVCGKRVRIHHKGKYVEAVINDACPECKYGDLDLTKPVFDWNS
ncbi:hypothetical protein MBANPS3_002701 [Mucor bainieri]